VGTRFDTSEGLERDMGITLAGSVLRTGGLVVAPADSAYAVVTDAFSSTGVAAIAAAKGRAREVPLTVLVSGAVQLPGLTTALSDDAYALVEAFWPGGLTLIARQQPTLVWDIGDTRATVSIRMPRNTALREVIDEIGPLASTSANRAGLPLPRTVAEAETALGDAVQVYLDGGPIADAVPSTIVDVTGAVPVVLRVGSLDLDRIREVVSGVVVAEP